ncbi:MAG TPA: hypothetical protein DD412_00780 [Holosporales bacterium]|nr:hypothetical protein [Holosporales bacterium]
MISIQNNQEEIVRMLLMYPEVKKKVAVLKRKHSKDASLNITAFEMANKSHPLDIRTRIRKMVTGSSEVE